VFVTNLKDCRELVAGDHTLLRELLHPARSSAQIGYSLAHGQVEAGKRSKRHRLASSEVYYFISGQGCFRVGEQSTVVAAGSVVYVPPGATQWVENTGSAALEFLCLVNPAWKVEDEEVLE
jgi:mannose-6-phosphate isomerase-like protein (cupin superfamily)